MNAVCLEVFGFPKTPDFTGNQLLIFGCPQSLGNLKDILTLHIFKHFVIHNQPQTLNINNTNTSINGNKI